MLTLLEIMLQRCATMCRNKFWANYNRCFYQPLCKVKLLSVIRGLDLESCFILTLFTCQFLNLRFPLCISLKVATYRTEMLTSANFSVVANNLLNA